MLLPEGWEQRFLETRFALKEKKKKDQIWISTAKWESGYHVSLRVRAITSTRECDSLKIIQYRCSINVRSFIFLITR